jgi:hypothetical protein
MSDNYSLSTEAAAIARPIIKQHHDHLLGRRVEFLFIERLDKKGKSQAITTGGGSHSLYGKAKLVTGLNAFLGATANDADDPQPFFVIVITKHFWDGAAKEFKEALIDHELSHCEYDSTKDKYSMVDHDVEEFTAIVKRHGAWKSDLDKFFKAAKQQSLAFESEPRAVATGPSASGEAEPAGNGGAATRTPKVRRIRGAKSKEQAHELLGG